MNHMENINHWVELSSGKDSIVTVIFGLLKDIAKMGKAIADLIGLAK
ncbi:hypothetical protein [Corynebacterium diphtheriae]|uniref:Uncharacterized protein n=2 Tax=Corynebacterium diphtheriae (strain ATCC 700971 / NCTC 13129 / Biotype gravis) TaxID=257309 RepID=Q6NF76_CORDI|nr:hypothetical protein [Corynebacterium diphtheriae]MBG9228242.1 hypothetical protein [Corynebacterium diphtheriae bv. gravis]MBG9250930.1 hypothetical protein [Corynebacterium diphtheriae bv. mitis]MBG9255245.1 hypothetical protein [Corynebacterium diphtheriae bv. mitis]MBG9262052.1 hypothetical protein [Corynebacterium diphtheriae bv. mitis]MBG9273043.1 hypothetical protein [Corynebacterium diphtheriae bv. mitis]